MVSFFENLRQAAHEITTELSLIPKMLETAQAEARSTMENADTTPLDRSQIEHEQARSDLKKYLTDNTKNDPEELISILKRIRETSVKNRQ